MNEAHATAKGAEQASVHSGRASDAFLSCFSVRHRQEVVEFGKRLQTVDADYLLFMARKAVCFYECLSALKLTELRGVLLSDRVLDMDLSWLRGKRVALIDDAVIYGTTLAKIAATLKQAGAIVTDIIVFCVNVTSWQPNRVQPSEPFLRLTEKETTGFCADLVRSISVVPIPYAVDYPLFRRLRIHDSDLPSLNSLPGWPLRAHTTPLQYAAGVSALVSTPSRSKRRDIFPDGESSLAKVCQLAKVRLYGRHLDKHSATWFTVMPVVVLDALAGRDVDRLWNCVLNSTGVDDRTILQQFFVSTTSKLRAIQFIIATRVVRAWMQDFKDLLGARLAPRIDGAYAGFSFAPGVARVVCSIATRGVDFSSAKDIKPANAGMLRIDRPLDTFEPNPWSLQAALIKPFLDLYLTKEVPARQQRLSIDELPDEVRNRLDEGFSLRQLKHSVTAIGGTLPSNAVLSEFLDHAIDRGFVVPITATQGDVAFRAYRYGEDIKDAEQFRQLCARCVQSYLDAEGSLGISRTWLEKLLVLLFQALLNQRLIDPTDLAMGSSGTVGVRYALHGIVLKDEASKVYSHYEGDFYVDVLIKYGFLRRTDDPSAQAELPQVESPESRDRVRYYLPVLSRDPIPESSEAVAVAEAVGLLVGTLAAKPAPSISSKDLTLLATCHSPASVTAALSAELDILKKNWRFTERKLRSADSVVTVSQIRDDVWFKAINSARWKYRDYMLDESERLLDQIEVERAAASDRESKYVLSSLRAFRRNRLSRLSYSSSDPRYLLLLELARLVYEINLLSRMIMLSLASTDDADATNDLKNELSELVQEHKSLLASAIPEPCPEHLLPRLILTAVQRSSEVGVERLLLRQWATEAINQRVAHVSEYLERVDHLIARVGLPNKFHLFPHVIVVELDAGAPSLTFERDVNSLLIRSTREFNSRLSGGRAYADVLLQERDPSGMLAVGFRGDLARGLHDLFLAGLRDLKSLPKGKRRWSLVDVERAEQPLISECSPRCVSHLFWERVSAVAQHPRFAAPGYYRLVPEGELLSFGEAEHAPNGESGEVVIVGSPTERRFRVDFEPTSPQDQTKTAHRRSGRADVGIICVTPSELNALRTAMKELPDFVEEAKSRYYSVGLQGAGCTHRVVMTFATSQRNTSAAIAALRFLDKYKPRLLVLVGMAGGINDDAKLLDVAVSTQVIYYEPRKERDSGVSSRVEMLPVSATLRRLITSFMADRGAPSARISYKDGAEAFAFSVWEGPIGTGEAVVGSASSRARQTVLNCNDKALVVETEAWGVHSAVFEAATEGSACKHVLTIKGVADRADAAKDDTRQYRATRNAFEVLRALLGGLGPRDLA